MLSTVELQSNDSIIVATTDDTNTEMSCEMKAYIRPDSSLIWEGPDGQRITPGVTNKHQITFTNGTPNASVNGDFVLFPSRLSTLTISNPEPSDNGTYTCSVVGTDQAITIELVVLNNADTTNSTNFTNTTPITTRLDISVIIGSVIAALGLLAFAAIALCFVGCVHNRRKKHNNDSYPMNEYPLTISGNDVDQTVVTSRVTVDYTESNKADRVVTDVIEAVEENKANDVATDDIDAMEENKAYGVVTDGIEVMEENKANGVATDDIDVMEENKAYGVVTNGTEAMEENKANGEVTDDIDAMEENKAYGVVTDGIDAMEENKANSVVTDGIEAMEENKAYSIVWDNVQR